MSWWDHEAENEGSSSNPASDIPVESLWVNYLKSKSSFPVKLDSWTRCYIGFPSSF